MTRQWAPGDVVSALLDGNEIVGLVRGGGRYVYYADSVTTDHVAMKHLRNIRPLVVIDPDDAEQVERLVCLLENLTGHANGLVALHIAAALREFANPKPPKPTEPTGLGAVVEDAKGERWIHRMIATRSHWCHETQIGWSDWSEIDAVRVLSDGVTA